MAVLRRTVTQFENTMLAVRFSGRWDDALEKDRDGYFFIDQDPKVFLPLLNFLRQCDQRKRVDVKIHPPPPTFEFCSMLEYYDLMSSVYPQEWRRVYGPTIGTPPVLGTDESVVIKRGNRHKDDSVTISSGKSVKAFMLEVQRHCSTKPVNATAFTATFDKGSTGQVGWAVGLGTGKKLGQDDIYGSFAFDLDSSQFMGNRAKLGNGQEWYRSMPVKIRCTYNIPNNTFAIQVLGRETDPVVMATLECGTPMYPHVNFSGKVTISDVVYAY